MIANRPGRRPSEWVNDAPSGRFIRLHFAGLYAGLGANEMKKYIVVEIVDGIRIPRSEPLSRHAAAIECARLSEDGYLVRVEPVGECPHSSPVGEVRRALGRLFRRCTASTN